MYTKHKRHSRKYICQRIRVRRKIKAVLEQPARRNDGKSRMTLAAVLIAMAGSRRYY